jgi:hypothetical protein
MPVTQKLFPKSRSLVFYSGNIMKELANKLFSSFRYAIYTIIVAIKFVLTALRLIDTHQQLIQ